MKSPIKKEGVIVQRVFFLIHFPASGLNLSNNISVTQVRVKIKEIERDATFEIP